jgi:hypothetical protein
MYEYKSLIIIEYKDVIDRNMMGGIFRLTQTKHTKRGNLYVGNATISTQIHTNFQFRIRHCIHDIVYGIRSCFAYPW